MTSLIIGHASVQLILLFMVHYNYYYSDGMPQTSCVCVTIIMTIMLIFGYWLRICRAFPDLSLALMIRLIILTKCRCFSVSDSRIIQQSKKKKDSNIDYCYFEVFITIPLIIVTIAPILHNINYTASVKFVYQYSAKLMYLSNIKCFNNLKSFYESNRYWLRHGQLLR